MAPGCMSNSSSTILSNLYTWLTSILNSHCCVQLILLALSSTLRPSQITESGPPYEEAISPLLPTSIFSQSTGLSKWSRCSFLVPESTARTVSVQPEAARVRTDGECKNQIGNIWRCHGGGTCLLGQLSVFTYVGMMSGMVLITRLLKAFFLWPSELPK